MDSADSVPDVDPVVAASAAHRTMRVGEDDRFTLFERDRLAARLRARALLDEQKLAAA